MAIAWRSFLLASGITWAVACAPHPAQSPGPVAAAGFRVLGNASPSDTGPPTLLLANRVITIRGMDLERTDGGLYGDVDSTQQGTLRLTLFDSVPGKTVQDVSPAPGWRQVLYEAQFGPLHPGPYEIWVGRWDPSSHTVVVTTQPLRVEVP
ncbi:MAG TPA: hypothetical protein VIG08_00860 [Gemmatimonadales bacterium]|jgi:hypothetical protein